MAEYITSTKTEVYFSGSWTDISSKVTSDLNIETGIYNSSPINRLASTGSLALTINNASGSYTPETAFKKGTPIRVTVRYNEIEKVAFFGNISIAKIDEGTWGTQSISIQALDWFDYATNAVIKGKTSESNKTIDQAVTSLLSTLAVQPQTTSLDTGNETFGLVFDGIQIPTPYAELNNLVMSELGYIYLRDGGKTLKVEANSTRNGINDISAGTYNSGEEITFAKDDTGSNFALSDGGGKILLGSSVSTTFSGIFDRTFEDLDIKYGDIILNDITVTAYPRDYDSNPLSLYDLYTYNLYTSVPAIPIPALGTITLTGGYTETYNGKPIGAAINVRTPDPTLGAPDYIFNSKADGSGSNLSANITQTFVGGANTWTWTLTNTGQLGFITYIAIVGQPIFKNNPVQATNIDTVSQGIYGDVYASLVQPYQQNTKDGVLESLKFIDDGRKPRTLVNSAKFIANTSSTNMVGYMLMDIGSLINIKSTKPVIDGYFYIQGIRTRITTAGIIYYEWVLKESNSFRKGLSPLAIKYSGVSSSKNVVTFLPNPKINNLTTKSISAWVYGKTSLTDVPIASKYDHVTGHELYVFANGMIQYLHAFSTTFGVFRTATGVVGANAWTNIVVTYDSSNVANVPVIYVNGVSKTVTVFQAPVGSSLNDSNASLFVGNQNYPASLNTFNFNGCLKDIRYYNRILTSTEVTTISGAENSYYSITSGLVFQLAGVRTDRYSDYLNNTITSDMKIADNIYGYRGTPSYDTSISNGQITGADPSLTSY